MPILEVEIVECAEAEVSRGAARRIADAAAEVLGTEPGRTWIKLRRIPRSDYAENGVDLDPELAPVFVKVLEARPPAGDELKMQARELTEAVARALDRAVDQVHVLHEPPALGRIAFGGHLKR